MTDPNRNVTLARYDALGRVVAVARGSDTGDGEVDLGDASQEFSYDLAVIPSVAYARVRDTHASLGIGTGWIETYAYSDGAGNVVMQKATAASDAATRSTPRWVGSGRVVLNNKGLPVKQYEPFFAASAAFEAEEGFEGVTPVITYDPLGRPTRVDLPNGTLRKVAFGPWSSVTWDENDCSDEAVDADPALVARAADHVGTPTVVKMDVQGRAYRTRGFLEAVDEEDYEASLDGLDTSIALDVLGNPTIVTDARGNAIQTQAFDLLGRPISTASPDGGDLTALLDAAGQPRFLWKSGDLCEEAEYDGLRRKVRTWEWGTAGTPAKTLRERFIYGEALLDEGTYDPADDDLRGRLAYALDGGGHVETAYDWKGNATGITRRFADDGEAVPDWTAADAGTYPFAGDDAASVADVLAAVEASLEGETFAAASTYDALDRVVTATAPDGQVTENTYDAGGKLTAVVLTTLEPATVTVVSAIAYNARGQREAIAYGNAAVTTYTYEADTFRLSRLYTVGGTDALQDLNYLYDPVGNVVSITNDAEDTLYHDNTAVEPSQAFTYDALYRLIEATGRERADRDAPGYLDPAAGSLPCTEEKRVYTQTFSYDEVGNIEQVVHVAGGSTKWTRSYVYAAGSNRLESTEVVSSVSGTLDENYVHDARGSMVYLPTLKFSSGGATPNVETSFRDQMVHAFLPTSGQEAFYAYDAGGQRVRKRVVTGVTTERRYVGGWEVYREYDGAGDIQEARSTLHVADGAGRMLLVETKTVTDFDPVTPPEPVLRYQLGDHLGTVAIELDGTGQIISYEEYHPYGTTAWRAPELVTVSTKRYRFTGMERDEETGLQCHGVRYYATWLGRWTSADPIGLGDGVNRFGYCHGGPVGGVDATGMDDEQPATPANGNAPKPGVVHAEIRADLRELHQGSGPIQLDQSMSGRERHQAIATFRRVLQTEIGRELYATLKADADAIGEAIRISAVGSTADGMTVPSTRTGDISREDARGLTWGDRTGAHVKVSFSRSALTIGQAPHDLPLTREVVLFHELVHALQNVNGVRTANSRDLVAAADAHHERGPHVDALRNLASDPAYQGATDEVLTVEGTDAFNIRTGLIYDRVPEFKRAIDHVGKFSENAYRTQAGGGLRFFENVEPGVPYQTRRF